MMSINSPDGCLTHEYEVRTGSPKSDKSDFSYSQAVMSNKSPGQRGVVGKRVKGMSRKHYCHDCKKQTDELGKLYDGKRWIWLCDSCHLMRTAGE